MFDTKIKVLVIDDMMTIRKIVKKALTDLQFSNFVEADNGVDAWKILQEQPDISLVISDWNMPKMTGVELLKLIRENPSTQHLPFMFLTAESEMGQIQQVMELGADNYVLKPFTPKDLQMRLEQTWQKVKGRIEGKPAA